MRRVVLILLIGLALAFGAFYVFSWPTTLSGLHANELGFDKVFPGEALHAGLMHFEVAGRRDVTVVTVKLNSPSVGIELDAVRVSLGASSIGSSRGREPSIEALPRAAGIVLRPSDAGSFVVSFHATRSGSFDGITITYQTGWLTRSVTLGPKVTVTVPAPATTPTSSPSP